MDWPNFFRGIFYSFLPQELWGSWRPSSTVDFTHSALASGLLEFVAPLYLLILGYVHFLFVRTHELAAGASANEGTQLYLLVLLSLEYVFHPLSLLAIYLCGEGALRVWAAFFTEEIIPSFPIKLIVFLRDRRKEKKEKASLGPPLPDLFERVLGGDHELRITSQSSKDGWRTSVTVAIEGEFYEIVRADTNQGDRRFVYLLRRLPAGSVIRGVYRYDPPSQAKPIGPSLTETSNPSRR